MKSVKMNEQLAKEIISWKYEPPYDFYNMDEEDREELLSYNAIVDNHHLIGFYCTGESAQVLKGRVLRLYDSSFIDIGLGLKPELTGKGFGKEFLTFIINELDNQDLRLTVAAFNQRAITLYNTFGFKKVAQFKRETTSFYVMKRDKSV